MEEEGYSMDNLLDKIKAASDKRLREITQYAKAREFDQEQREPRVEQIIIFLKDLMQILVSKKLNSCEIRNDRFHNSSPGIVIINIPEEYRGYYIAFGNNESCDFESLGSMAHYSDLDILRSVLLEKNYLEIKGLFRLLGKNDAYVQIF